MVGSVLMQRMQEENDFAGIEPVFFSTSQAGQAAPMGNEPLKDASDLAALKQLDVIITCQGGDYTKATHPELRKAGWQGYWIDAASTLRMEKDARITSYNVCYTKLLRPLPRRNSARPCVICSHNTSLMQIPLWQTRARTGSARKMSCIILINRVRN